MKLTATHYDHVVIMSTSHPRQHAKIQRAEKWIVNKKNKWKKICGFHNHTNNFPSLQATTFAEVSFDWAVAFSFHHELFSVLSNYLFVYTWSVTTCIRKSNSDFVPLFSDKFSLSNEEVERRVRPKFDYFLVENSLSVYFFWNSILSGTALRFLFHLPSAYQNRKFVSFGSELRSNTNTIDPMSQLHWDWVVAVKAREFANPSGNCAMVVQFMHKHLGLV